MEINNSIRPDYTEGTPFWKWFFEQTANLVISLMTVIAPIVLYVQPVSTNEFIIGSIVALVWGGLNLGLSYRSYKQLQKGISK